MRTPEAVPVTGSEDGGVVVEHFKQQKIGRKSYINILDKGMKVYVSRDD